MHVARVARAGQRLHALSFAHDLPNVLADALFEIVVCARGVPGTVFQRELETLTALGRKDAPENFSARLGVREQQLQKVALRNHHDLGKLRAVHAD